MVHSSQHDHPSPHNSSIKPQWLLNSKFQSFSTILPRTQAQLCHIKLSIAEIAGPEETLKGDPSLKQQERVESVCYTSMHEEPCICTNGNSPEMSEWAPLKHREGNFKDSQDISKGWVKQTAVLLVYSELAEVWSYHLWTHLHKHG